MGGVEDDSCMNAHVINSDPNPVTVQADATVPDGSAGVFDGSNYLTVSYANQNILFQTSKFNSRCAL